MLLNVQNMKRGRYGKRSEIYEPWSSPCSCSTMSENSNISSAFRTSEADMLLCCFDRATSWALKMEKKKKRTRQSTKRLTVDKRT
jgi:hypothetical protein